MQPDNREYYQNDTQNNNEEYENEYEAYGDSAEKNQEYENFDSFNDKQSNYYD